MHVWPESGCRWLIVPALCFLILLSHRTSRGVTHPYTHCTTKITAAETLCRELAVSSPCFMMCAAGRGAVFVAKRVGGHVPGMIPLENMHTVHMCVLCTR